MKKLVKESINTLIPSFDELRDTSPDEIKDIINKSESVPQSPNWHPEAPDAKVPHNVLAHMKIVYDRAAKSGDINMAVAAFFHDLGKVDTTHKNNKGSWSAHGHEEVSARLAHKYSRWITEQGADAEEVFNIVKLHMKIKLMDDMRPSKQAEMRASPYFDKLNKFSEHDNMRTLTDEEKNRYR